MTTSPPRLAVLVGLCLWVAAPVQAQAASAPGVAVGSHSGLPFDADLVGCWLRQGTDTVRGEALCFAEDGTYRRVGEEGEAEEGLWTSLVRDPLRWMRRCPHRPGAAVSPEECEYFGRYQLDADEMVEEEVCPRAWQGMITRGRRFDDLKKGCPSVARRIDGEMTEGEMRAALAEITPTRAAPVPDASDSATAKPPASAEALHGTWVGRMGVGPAEVVLTFTAQPDGVYEYVLEAAGMAEKATGKWRYQDGTLVLEHETGEVEKIPVRAGDKNLYWTDEDFGELLMAGSGG